MKKILLVIILVICMSMLTSCLLISTQPDATLSRVVKEMDNSFSFGNGEEAYKLGYNCEDMPVFIDPNKAFLQMKNDYAEELNAIKEQFDLDPIGGNNWYIYGNLGWQITTQPDGVSASKGIEVSQFFDYYENSFSDAQISEFIK